MDDRFIKRFLPLFFVKMCIFVQKYFNMDLHEQIKPAFTDLKKVEKTEAANYKNYKLMPIELLVKADWNYKKENPYTSDKLQANLKRNGQVENIQVRLLPTGYYEVINGNHRLEEMQKLGRKTVVVYDHGDISLAQAKRIALETNETKFAADETMLAEVIRELEAEFGLEDLDQTMPFSDEEMEEMMREMEAISYADKNKEIDTSEFSDKMTMKFEFSQDEYMFIQEKLSRVDANKELAILKILGYDS